jgi:hypothetical protein
MARVRRRLICCHIHETTTCCNELSERRTADDARRGEATATQVVTAATASGLRFTLLASRKPDARVRSFVRSFVRSLARSLACPFTPGEEAARTSSSSHLYWPLARERSLGGLYMQHALTLGLDENLSSLSLCPLAQSSSRSFLSLSLSLSRRLLP